MVGSLRKSPGKGRIFPKITQDYLNKDPIRAISGFIDEKIKEGESLRKELKKKNAALHRVKPNDNMTEQELIEIISVYRNVGSCLEKLQIISSKSSPSEKEGRSHVGVVNITTKNTTIVLLGLYLPITLLRPEWFFRRHASGISYAISGCSVVISIMLTLAFCIKPLRKTNVSTTSFRVRGESLPSQDLTCTSAADVLKREGKE